MISKNTASANRFASEMANRLKKDACWRTRGTGDFRFASASDIVLPEKEEFAGFLNNERYLDPRLASDNALCDLVSNCGAKRFTVSSLVRLRCAGSEENSLETKLGNDANFYFPNYNDSLTDIDRQKRIASALSAYPRLLKKPHKVDLANTPSTLSATGELKPAAQLMIVDPDLWAACPEPEANRLHPELVAYKAISSHCRTFNEEQWLIDAAGRAAMAPPDDRERETLYRRLLAREAPIGQRIRTALRNNPVVKNQRGEWVAPVAMAHLKGSVARLLDPAIDMPSEEMLSAPRLLASLRIRRTLSGADLISFARQLAERPAMAERFEKLLTNNLKLLSTVTVAELRVIPCLKALSNKLMPPAVLHLDTAANRLCIGDDNRIVGGANRLLYDKLKLKAAPDVKTLLDVIELHREQDKAPARPDILYPALVEAIGKEPRSKSTIADLPICWVQEGYFAPSTILVGSRIPLPLAEAVPVYQHSDKVGRAYQDLGAPEQPDNSHWTRFFRHVGANWSSEVPLDARRRRVLLEAYSARGALGLPPGLDDVRCLIDDQSRLFTRAELRLGMLVEPDFQPLQEALRAANSKIGMIERSDRSRAFFRELGIRPLSAIAGTGEPELGLPERPKFWYKSKHSERVLAMLHRPIFGRALFEVADRNRDGHPGFAPLHVASIEARLSAIREITFVQTIERRYSVGGTNVLVPVQVAVTGERIGFIAPKTKNSFQLLLSEALAEIAGATSVSTIRSIANAFLPLVLFSTSEELIDYFDRMGITLTRHREPGEVDSPEFEMEDEDDVEELAFRQVFDDLHTSALATVDQAELIEPASPPTNPAPAPSASDAAPPFELPDIGDVSLVVSATDGTKIEPRGQPIHGGGSSSGVWLPATPAEVKRNALVGRRGEELVYRLELQKVREMGYAEPERYVIWTSRDEPGADHDIRSIDVDGKLRWIEVKSTTGVDGRFDWPRKEFEKALRDRDQYELWRVYRVADRTPVAKCFRNPISMLGTHQLYLELGMLRANLEPLG